MTNPNRTNPNSGRSIDHQKRLVCWFVGHRWQLRLGAWYECQRCWTAKWRFK
jgi:hypothetical protein